MRIFQYDQPLSGSMIVDQIEKHGKEIDERIVSDVRQHSILEEIDEKYPEAIEALYSEFRYAARAKNQPDEAFIKQEKDPEKWAQIESERQSWQYRVHRVLMVYIQQYELGRLIGPHLNWSGIFRSDEWLMEHFRSPTVHVPRSLMPAFPFDDTKFRALTFMLDRLAVRNRNMTRAIWEHQGFHPVEAFQIHCSQCHGINLQGFGAVAEWIYPLPKSLMNADFLRNLTKERAIYSIMHGVQGTPIPPWGEVADDKPSETKKISDYQPVLTENEIRHLVDWLFSFLPGREVIRTSEDVRKWQYGPQDVLHELMEEGGRLNPMPIQEAEQISPKQVLPERELPEENNPTVEPKLQYLLSISGEQYAAIRPEIYPREAPQGAKQVYQVQDVFDIFSDSTGPDPYRYYIKQQYYTPYNIQQGQKFFLLNCAICHGNEGDGSGARGQAMQDAKPRMFTNLDWINSRDDLRLLRSIKYGVPGTSMTPWGDLTNSLQRMQLVMFIRRLSQEQKRRSILDTKLYQIFDTAQLVVENARVKLSIAIEQDKNREKEIQKRQKELENQVLQGKVSIPNDLKIYQQSLEITKRLQKLQEQDQQLIQLKNEIKHEKDIYQSLGLALIEKGVGKLLLDTYFQILDLHKGRYSLQEGRLVTQDKPKIAEQARGLRQVIVQEIDRKIADLEKREEVIEGKISSAEKAKELTTIKADILTYQKLKDKIISDSEAALRSANKQLEGVYSFF